MKNVIIGTAGHVDHGKTCLIKALTGVDCDRLQEEKKRGITIENGFADMTYGDYSISIIDVPGHEKFVRNMLMGIGGIDLVLLVVALDEGVMPQTREHFGILSMLDISSGIIVFTKKDMVSDADWIELVKEDTRAMVKGSFMEGCDEIEVSSVNGTNIEELRELIVKNIDRDRLKNESEVLFRLPVDRVFTISGFGTIVTGTLIEGTVHKGDEVMLYPQEKTCRIRNVQVHNQTVDAAYAGQRTALNLQDVKKDGIERGSVLALPGSLEVSRMINVSLEMFKDTERTVLNGSRVHFYCGASEATAKVVLPDREALSKGEKCLCQLRLEEEVAIRRKDRFIIRFLSPLESIGGGKVLEVNAKKLVRFSDEGLRLLDIYANGSEKEILSELINAKSSMMPSAKELAVKQRLSPDECSGLLSELLAEKKIREVKTDAYVSQRYIDRFKEQAKAILEPYHTANEMSWGIAKEEFKSRLLSSMRCDNKKDGELFVNLLIEDKFIKNRDGLISLYDFEIKESEETRKLKERILAYYASKAYEMPEDEELIASEKDSKNALHALNTLTQNGQLVRLSFKYHIDRKAYDKALDGIKDWVKTHDGKITLAEFRDIIGTSRKYAMAILDYLDEKKITRKIDDYRVLESEAD